MNKPRKHWSQTALETALGWLPHKRYRSEYPIETLLIGVVRNEDHLLVEWVAHYHAIGFDKVILGDFGLSDFAMDLLSPFVKKGFLELIPLRGATLTTHAQKKFYNRMIRANSGRARWMAFFDSDEFLGPDEDLKQVLSRHGTDPTTGAIMVNWVMYGTSGVESEPKGPFYMETFQRRAPRSHGEHWQVKTLLRPESAVGFFSQMHFPVMRKGRKAVFGSGKPFNWGEGHIEWEPLRLAHYWYRSESFYRDVKIPRRLALMGDDRSESRWKGHKELCNMEYDDYMDRFVKGMKNSLDHFGIKDP